MLLRVLLAMVLSAVLFSCSRGEARNEAADASQVAGLPNDSLSSSADSLSPRAIAGFITMLAGVSPDEASRSMDALIGSVAEDSVTFSRLSVIMERLLADPNSPLRNESHYIIYLESLLRQPGLDEAGRVRVADRLATAKKNRPGAVATDFAYVDREGRAWTLHKMSGRRLLLIFYDPECGHCSEILEQVSASDVIKERVRQKKLTVLAIYTEGDRNLWERTKASMPRDWAVGFDTDSIVGRELYSVPAMPVMYLLDGNKTVLLKDAFLPEIEEMLTTA